MYGSADGQPFHHGKVKSKWADHSRRPHRMSAGGSAHSWAHLQVGCEPNHTAADSR